MEILLLNVVSYEPPRWIQRQPQPSEIAPLNLVRQAALRAANLSPAFLSTIWITEPAELVYHYDPLLVYPKTGEMSIHEAFFRKYILKYTVDELASLFLHENAHYLQARRAGIFDHLLANDLAWQQTLRRFPEIARYNPSWFSEITCDIYATQRTGKASIVAIEKFCRHYAQHFNRPYNVEHFGGGPSHPPLREVLEILHYYQQRRDALKAQSLLRMPVSPRRTESTYQTVQSTRDEEIGRDGQRRYFNWLVREGEGGGYDLLALLLKWHPGVEISGEWQSIHPRETEDAHRQSQIRQFIHDVRTLMKLLLGSANLCVAECGEFASEELPYGAVRSNRGALTKTALHPGGSIDRIKQELRRSGLDTETKKQITRRLNILHRRIEYPSFEQQREDLRDLSVSVQISKTEPQRANMA